MKLPLMSNRNALLQMSIATSNHFYLLQDFEVSQETLPNTLYGVDQDSTDSVNSYNK